MDAPESESEALRFLAEAGFTADFTAAGNALTCSVCGHSHDAARLIVRHTFRFEGITDPGDESIVLGLECPECGALGVLVSAYGPDADEALLTVIENLGK